MAQLGDSSQAGPDNGMRPTANTAAFMRETRPWQRFVAAGGAGRGAASNLVS